MAFPAVGCEKPGWHATQPVLPRPSTAVPDPQGVQLLAPPRGAMEPAGHCSQATAAAAPWKEPAAHASHCRLLRLKKLPEGEIGGDGKY